MEFKEEFKRLVSLIKSNALSKGLRLRNEDIAKRLGYNPDYFSTLTGKSGTVTKQHIDDIKIKFKDELAGIIKEKVGTEKNPIYSLLASLLDEAAEARADRLNIPFEEAKAQIKKKSNLIQDGLDSWLAGM